MKTGLWVAVVAILATAVAGFAPLALAEGGNNLVDLKSVNPRIIIDLKYATDDNFMKQKVYTDTRCLVLPTLAQKLDRAQRMLEADGLGLKIYDGFRPLSVQKKMWALFPKPGYVANPYEGGSHHNRGAAADLTLVDSLGQEIEMPTPFDTFSDRAHQFSLTPTPQQRANRMLLRSVMQSVGLVAIKTEWWHYQLPDAAKYPVIP